MEEIKYKYFAWSYDKAYLDEIIGELAKREISCICENDLGRYFLSVPCDYYQTSLAIIREIGADNKIGSINFYDKIRPLNVYSLAYAVVEDATCLNKNWENEAIRPRKIKKMIKELKDICGCNVELAVDTSNNAVEIMATENLNNSSRIKEKICNFLRDNNYVKFKEVHVCTPEGEVMNPTPEEMLKIKGIYRLFDTSFLSNSMYTPERVNLVSKENEEGRLAWKQKWGFTDDIKFIEEYREDKIVIMGETKLYETKYYNSAGEAISCAPNNPLSFETKLVDDLDYTTTIILSDNQVAKITTKYKDSREVKSSRQLPFGVKFPESKSVRDGFLPFPKENGKYEGTIEEYYMRSTDGTKLLHYATHTPYFEIFDIPDDFDFINNNSALEGKPSTYDIRDYNPEEPKLAPVKDLINNTVKKLELDNKSD